MGEKCIDALTHAAVRVFVHVLPDLAVEGTGKLFVLFWPFQEKIDAFARPKPSGESHSIRRTGGPECLRSAQV